MPTIMAVVGLACCGMITMASAIDGGPDAVDLISTGRYTLAIYTQLGADVTVVDQSLPHRAGVRVFPTPARQWSTATTFSWAT